MRISIVFVVGLLLCIGNTLAWTGFTSVVSRLVDYQTPSGGFRGHDGKPTTEATANALLLASIYGLRNKINTTEAAKFIKSVENTDGGYGPAPSSPSDVEAVRNALLSLQFLGGKPTNPTNIINYIKSLVDNSNHLFAYRVGEKGSVKGTALALESVDLLGELNQKWVQDTFPKIKEELGKHRASGDVLYFAFPEDKTVSQVSANYYAVVVAKYVGFDFGGDAGKWAKYIVGLQSPAGQFYDSLEKKTTSLNSTAHAVYTLNALHGVKGATERFVDSVNVDALKSGVRHIAADISAAAQAHSALALTKAFKDFFKFVVNYEGSADSYILEGASLKPSLSVSSIFGDLSSAHGGFDVSTSTVFHGKAASKGKLTWDQELQRYIGEHLPTLGNLGPVKQLFNFAHKVAGLGELVFEHFETKNIGYGITVLPKAHQPDGREIHAGDSVSAGADFVFAVGLSTRTNDDLRSGDFTVTFSVLDSSHVTIHQSSVSGATNKDSISFSYKLSSAALPPGQLTFNFDVAGSGVGSVAHTSKSIAYQYAVPLVASNIQFASGTTKAGTVFRLGDNVKLSIQPAAFPDLRTPHVLSHKDGKNNDISDLRHFILDIKSPQGVLIASVPSVATKASSKYDFEVKIEPTLDFIGTNVLSFRYVPAVGEEVHLQNYDSSINELYEDIQVLNFTVKADLSLVDVASSPKAGNHFFGGNIAYKFRIKDSISGQYVYAGSHANVFLDLQHDDAGSSYTSVHHAAAVRGEGKDKTFYIDWIINPNAVRGGGSLVLSALDVDGAPLSIKESKPLKVNISGDIEVKPHTYTTAVTTSRNSAIVAEFGLTTRNKTLKGAELSATLVHPGSGDVITTLPVAHHNGRYTVSWSAPHNQVPSGDYKLLFYRNIDRAHAQEKREQREKKERKERLLRGESDEKPATTVGDEELNLQPLFVIDISYSAPRFTSLPLRAEFISFVSLTTFFVWLYLKKSNPK